MSEQTDTASVAATPKRPTINDSAYWSAYWHALGQTWRTEPEIDEERQRFLRSCLRTIPHDEPDIYPFLYVKLTRADVEWMLANPLYNPDKVLDSMQRMVKDKLELSLKAITDFRREINYILDIGQHIDLRGADMRQVNLARLQLTEARLEGANLDAAN